MSDALVKLTWPYHVSDSCTSWIKPLRSCNLDAAKLNWSFVQIMIIIKKEEGSSLTCGGQKHA